MSWLALLAAASPHDPPHPSPSPSPCPALVCGLPSIGHAATAWPSLAWHWLVTFVTGHRWQFAAVALVAVCLYIAARLMWRRWWRRDAARSRWVQVAPPRTIAVEQADDVWRLMSRLATAAHHGGGWRLTRPPLALEIHHDGQRLSIGLWRPAHLPGEAVADVVEQAWPGAIATEAQPPNRGTWRWWAGFRLAVVGTDAAILTDEPQMKAARGRGSGSDPLRSVLHGLRAAPGDAALQVLLRPASNGRLRALRRAANGTGKPRRHRGLVVVDGLARVLLGVIRAVLDFLTPGPSRPAHGGRPRAGAVVEDPLVKEARRKAAVKAEAGPFLLAAVRVVAGAHRRRAARAGARRIIDGYAMTSHRGLRPAVLRRPVAAVTDRWVRRREWMLLTVGELGVLAHLPADPASYGIDTTAMHRAAPAAVTRPTPEHPTGHLHGWTRRDGWQPLVADPDDADPDDGEYSDAEHGDREPDDGEYGDDYGEYGDESHDATPNRSDEPVFRDDDLPEEWRQP